MKTAELSIWFLTVHFDRTVHAGPLGFTTVQYPFAFGVDVPDAIERCKRHYRERYDLGVVKASARPALEQDLKRYTFPEQVIK